MKTIDEKILDLIDDVGSDSLIMKYVYNNTKFIPGSTPIYYSGPFWDKNEVSSAMKSLLMGAWLSSGEAVNKFENELSRKINQKYALMVNSGSSANLVMITALKKLYDWKDGDEIIMSSVGFPTTYSPVIQNKLNPVFIDIEMDTLNFDVTKIEKQINSYTRAIFVSPVLGNPPDMDRIQCLCVEHDLLLILDNCDSLGTKWNGNYLNEYATASSYSFYASHEICTGEGGMVMTNNKELMRLMRSITNWGRDCWCVGSANLLPQGGCNRRFDKWLDKYDGIIDHKYYFTNIGYNLKPLDLQGAIGSEQVKKLDEICERRKESYNRISESINNHLADVAYMPTVLSGADVVWFGTPIVCKDKEVKDRLVAYLEENKIQTRNYFAGNILIHPAFEKIGNYEDYPTANQVLDRVLFIGASPHYHEEIFQYIDKILKEFK